MTDEPQKQEEEEDIFLKVVREFRDIIPELLD